MRDLINVGDLILDRYEATRNLGRGGFGTVWLCLDRHLEREVAVKLLLDVHDEANRTQFTREARILSKLDHPALPSLYEYIDNPDQPLLIMQYISGDSLLSILDARNKSVTTPLDVDAACAIAIGLIDVVSYLHGIPTPLVHKDITPNNICLTADGKLYLVDFGLSKGAASGDTINYSAAGANLAYCAPEQLSSTTSTTLTDIYMVGSTLYHVFGGTRGPTAAERLNAIATGGVDPLTKLALLCPHVPQDISDAIEHMLSLNTADRPSTINEPRGAFEMHGTVQTVTRGISANRLEDGIRADRSLYYVHRTELFTAIQQGTSRQAYYVREYCKWLDSRVVEMAPDYSSMNGQNDPYDDLLYASLEASVALVADFCRLAEEVALADSQIAGIALYRGLALLANRYYLPLGHSGSFRNVDFDYFRFIGHELLVSLTAMLMREERWQVITAILDELISVPTDTYGRDEAARFTFLSQGAELFRYRDQRLKLLRVSTRADLINERHTSGTLSTLVPMTAFVDADLFLYLRGELERESDDPNDIQWRPWSALYLQNRTPEFLARAVSRKFADTMCGPLGVTNVDVLRKRLAERARKLRKLFSVSPGFDVLSRVDFSTIGTR